MDGWSLLRLQDHRGRLGLVAPFAVVGSRAGAVQVVGPALGAALRLVARGASTVHIAAAVDAIGISERTHQRSQA